MSGVAINFVRVMLVREYSVSSCSDCLALSIFLELKKKNNNYK